MRWWSWVLALFCSTWVFGQQPRHVVLLIADGMSFNSWRMTSIYEDKLGNQPYEQPGWVRFGVTTWPLRTGKNPDGGTQPDPALFYDPAQAWSAEPAPVQDPAKDPPFEGYRFLLSGATDSAAAATAMSTGVKTYNQAVAWSNATVGAPLTSITDLASAAGLSCGTVTNVLFYHATPAAFGAHVSRRGDYAAIAQEMLTSGKLSVIMGAGHPLFDNAGQPRRKPTTFPAGDDTWDELAKAEADKSEWRGYRVITAREDFERLADEPAAAPAKLIGIVRASQTTQQARSKPTTGEAVGQTPRNPIVPDLSAMSRAALNVLAKNPRGFFLMIEGGAGDWASHNNQPSRVVEEHMEFNAAVAAVVAWIERPGDAIDWSNTLVVITTDHGNGLPLGPRSQTVFFDPVPDTGKGTLPPVVYYTRGHTRELVPLFARGVGAERFGEKFAGRDERFRAMYGLDDRWPADYIDNTDVFRVIRATLLGDAGGK